MFQISCWLAVVAVSGHCLSVWTILNLLQDTDGCICEGGWTQSWTHGSCHIAHVIASAILVTAKAQQVQEHSGLCMLQHAANWFHCDDAAVNTGD